MDFTLYALFVTAAALAYSFLAREMQFRFGNRKEMDAFQKKSKALTDEMNEAGKRKDSKRIDELMKQQGELMKEMGGIMLGQFKTMGLILIIFFAFTWAISNFDPTTKDDVTLQLQSEGQSEGNGIFSASYAPANEEYGAWVVDVKALNDGNVIGENSTYFSYGPNSDSPHVKMPKGEPVAITLSKQSLAKGEQIKITAVSPKAHSMTATLDGGTRFYVDLPFTIPILEIKRINEAYWWFIFVAILSGLAISFVMGKIQQKPKPGENK